MNYAFKMRLEHNISPIKTHPAFSPHIRITLLSASGSEQPVLDLNDLFVVQLLNLRHSLLAIPIFNSKYGGLHFHPLERAASNVRLDVAWKIQSLGAETLDNWTWNYIGMKYASRILLTA
ncbi:hypothetical protein Tco_1553667 [Tanacetum coccineum]